MSFNELRLEHALEGISNIFSWKDMREFVWDDNGVWVYTQIDIPKPRTLDAQALACKISHCILTYYAIY